MLLTTQPAASQTPKCPAGAAQWFTQAHSQVTKEDLGCHFHAVLEAWTRMEAAAKYESSTVKLPKTHRPAQVDTWISRARGKRPADTTVHNPAAYAVGWQKWWDSLQPKWRTKDADGSWSTSDPYGGPNSQEWGNLYTWGANGTLSVVVSLYFWGVAVSQSEGEAQSLWEKAVLDVGWMLEGMAIYYEKFNHRF
ncbi:hypothetical protein DFH06DRAFT_985083 [Mycena polygramma]|nr:hypothetical protein DFH06DRAFT_985083 [Mycena polygramma]